VLYGITQWIETVRGYSESAIGFTVAGNQTALYRAAPAAQPGTVSGLLRTFGYVAAIVVTGVVFHTRVDDRGVHLIAWIMTAVSLVLTVLSVATLRPRTARAGPRPSQ
jgi:hypothetical protein